MTGIGICTAVLQSMGGRGGMARVYLDYHMKGCGVWLIPATFGMAETLIIIPVIILKSIWIALATGSGLPLKPKEENLRGPPVNRPSHQLPLYSWAAKEGDHQARNHSQLRQDPRGGCKASQSNYTQ